MIKILIFMVLMIFALTRCKPEKILYMITEHPVITYINPKYFRAANVSSRRYSREDPFYYVTINFESLYELHNNVTLDFYFYEFLTNRYRRGFVEMHFLLCDLVEKDVFFGSALRQGNFAKTCPFPAGSYNLSNMTIPIKNIPHNFPFTKGRIYGNFSVTNTREKIGTAYIDMEIKETRTNKRTWVDSP